MVEIPNASNPSKSILVLIPAYNEAERIAGVIASTKRFFPVLVVDDGSTDETADIASGLGAEVIRQYPNRGKGAALLEGFKYANDNGYEAVLTLDADGQHDPEEIPLFIGEFNKRGRSGHRETRFQEDAVSAQYLEHNRYVAFLAGAGCSIARIINPVIACIHGE